VSICNEQRDLRSPSNKASKAQLHDQCREKMRDISLVVIESIMNSDTIVDEVVFKTPVVDCMKRLRFTEANPTFVQLG